MPQTILDILSKNKIISEDQVKKIEQEAKKSGRNFEEILLEKNITEEENLIVAKSELYQISEVDLVGKEIDKEILELIPQKLAENYRLVAFAKENSTLKIAMQQPGDLKAREAAEFIAHKNNLKVSYFITSLKGFNDVIKQYGGIGIEIEEALQEAKGALKEVSVKDVLAKKGFEDVVKSAPISKMVSLILSQAVENKASDIHIEPGLKETRVRYRIDGVLATKMTLPKYVHAAVVSRIKVMANLKIDETRIPQDGRFRTTIAERNVDFRVSTLPLIDNEKVVIRILETEAKAPTLEELGFMGRNLEVMKDNTKKARGLFLVTGPTGSGKTTTLYAILNILNKEGVNIVTLEDPVEYYLGGVNQSQVNPGVGLTFASGLRSIVRQDPDIIMVGEVRDSETAELAIHAGLTGHVVLSTLHTQDAFGAVPRLIDMEQEPFLLASTLNSIIAQRLVRKICDSCRQEVKLTADLRKEVKQELAAISNLKEYSVDSNNLKFYHGKGCEKCDSTGYSGRVAIIEVLAVSDELKNIIVSGCKIDEVKAEFKRQDMLSMKQDGIIKALQGITSVEEVIAATKK